MEVKVKCKEDKITGDYQMQKTDLDDTRRKGYKHMNEILRVQCDKCGNIFLMTPDDIKIDVCEINNQKFQVMYFSCGDCGKVSIIAIKDFECIKLTAEIRELSQRLAQLKDERKIKDLKQRRIKKQTRLGNRIERLKYKFDGEFESSNNKLIYHE